MLLMTVAAQNHTGLKIAETISNGGGVGSHEPAFWRLLDEILAQLIQGGDAVWLPELRAQSSVAPVASRHGAWTINGAGVGGIG